MRDILDPVDRWIGTPGAVSVFGNKPPIALLDSVTMLVDGGPISIDVLANDYDPEGGQLTLLAASAGLGTAVAETDGTVTYTPFPGLAGLDSIAYDIEDPDGQRRTGQVTVTILEPTLSIETHPDNTLTIRSATGLLDITVTEPSAFAGTYQIDSGDLDQGPVNLVPPVVQGTIVVGATLAIAPGLWVHDVASGPLTTSWQWRRNGVDIAGETASSYEVLPGDSQAGISVAETESDSEGQRTAVSATLGGSFSPIDDIALLGWWDANDTATIFESGGVVSGWADKSGGTAFNQSNTQRRPTTGLRTINGINALDFDGSQFLERAETVPVSGDIAFHMLVEIDSTASAFEAVLAVDATNDFQFDSNSGTQFDGRLNMSGIGTGGSLTGGPFSGTHIVSLIFDRSGTGQAEVFISDVSRLSTAYSTPIDSAAQLILMANRSRNAWVNGAIGEVIITGDVTNRAEHHAYLATKWGVA